MRAPLTLLLALVGCTGGTPAQPPLVEGPALIAVGDWSETVGDQLPRVRVGFRDGEGDVAVLDRQAVAYVARWRDGAALIDQERRLYQVWPGGRRRMLAADVSALATDGERLAFVVRRDLHAELRIHDGSQARPLASDLASIGVLRVEPERVLFVGARAGGVAGVWVADASGARCVTNCDLRTGQPWLDRFEPPPSDPDLLVAP